MRHVLCIVLLAACGGTRPTESTPSNAGTATPDALALELREIVDSEGGRYAVWLQADRASGLDTADACCGLSYDGNKYDDALATCLTGNADCGEGWTAVYPGLADDKVCIDERRCVPLPTVRVIADDATQVSVDDEVGRDGFVTVTIGDKTQLVAVDYGKRYTIVVRDGAVERVTRDL